MTKENTKAATTTTDGDEEGDQVEQESTTTKTKTKAVKPDPNEDDEADQKKAAKAQDSDLNKQLKAMAKRLEAFEAKEAAELEKTKTAEQKLADRDAELAKQKRENLVLKKAIEKGLDPKLIDRVKGDSDDEIDSDIESLLELFAKGKPENPESKGSKAQPPKQTKTDDKNSAIGLDAKNQNWMDWRKNKLAR